jgi:hypothetical protein
MLIFCTKDADLIAAWQQSQDWGAVYALMPDMDQADATTALQNLLANLDVNEALCIAAHGSNAEIGDSGNGPDDWTWSAADIASYLDVAGVDASWKTPVPTGQLGARVLFQVCCTDVANFSAAVAIAMEGMADAPCAVWCYGYNTSVAFNTTLPTPAQLTTNVSLQGTLAWAAV